MRAYLWTEFAVELLALTAILANAVTCTSATQFVGALGCAGIGVLLAFTLKRFWDDLAACDACDRHLGGDGDDDPDDGQPVQECDCEDSGDCWRHAG
jgi:hypothetical protein